jgi:hypothetical protein
MSTYIDAHCRELVIRVVQMCAPPGAVLSRQLHGDFFPGKVSRPVHCRAAIGGREGEAVGCHARAGAGCLDNCTFDAS